jgi:hypothetical protein
MFRFRAHTAALALAALAMVACGGGGYTDGGGTPQVQFQVPADGATLRTPVMLSATGTALSSVEFAVDQSVVASVDLAPFAWTFEPAGYAEGAHEIRVTAFHASGSAVTTVSVTVEHMSSPGGSTVDPGFSVPTNVIQVTYDAGLSAEQNGDLLEAVIESLQPNDRVIIGGGTYVMNSRLTIDVAGTAQNPVSIEAADGEQVRIHRPLDDQNIVDLDYARYLTIRGIEFSGGSAGIRFIDCAYIFFHDNEVHDTGDAAITANSGNTDHLYLVDNHVHHTSGYGEGFYIGANDAAAITHDTYIVGNHVHDTGDLQGDGIELKIGSYGCVIADNVIERTNYPGILVYGNGGRPERNVIERNVIIDSSEGGIQVAADAIVRNNLIVGAAHACIVSQSHQGATPGNLTIVHNTLVNDGDCLAVSSWGGSGIVFANNALYSSTGSEIYGNTGAATLAGNVLLNAITFPLAFVDLTLGGVLGGVGLDATPAPGSVLIGAGDPSHAVADDLTGEARVGTLESGAVDLR